MPRVADSYLEARRNEILDAAMTCFARQGFHRTTMRDIVAESGLSAGAIYRYFSSKEDIVAAIAESRRLPDTSMLRAVSNSPDARSGLRLLADALGQLSDPDEQRWRRVTIQVWGEALRDDRVMDIAREGFVEPIKVMTELIQRGQREGSFPGGVDAEAAARICASMFYGLVLQQAWDPGLDVKAYIATVKRILDELVNRNDTRALDRSGGGGDG